MKQFKIGQIYNYKNFRDNVNFNFIIVTETDYGGNIEYIYKVLSGVGFGDEKEEGGSIFQRDSRMGQNCTLVNDNIDLNVLLYLKDKNDDKNI